MKAKNILKTLALPVAVALGMMATSCSSDDNIVNEQQAGAAKHEIPVTVSATRSGDDATRATFNETSKKLEFEEGDKLFIQGTDATAGTFAGVLSNTSGAPGTFSGTVTTQKEYTGTSEDLFSSASSLTATLLPKDYSTIGYLTLSGTGYSQSLTVTKAKAFVTAASADAAKALAIEQLSLEQATTYSSGFALQAKNAIINYAISSLSANTSYSPSITDGTTTVSGSVNSDGSGKAYFAVGFTVNGSSKNYTLTGVVASSSVPAGAFSVSISPITASGKTLEPNKVYNKTATAPAFEYVKFSTGNLQYIGSATTPYWKFAEHQYDYLGTTTGQNSSATNVDRDLFGWGTGDNPTNTSTNNNNYSTFNDWGKLAISNGGNTANSGWRTLTKDEWEYLFNTRSASTVGTTANARYAKAKVCDVQGVILFPDDYTHPSDVTTLVGINVEGNTGWNGNTYDATAWSKMETAGCVFLPAAGCRGAANGTSVLDVGSFGSYWSSTPTNNNGAYNVRFGSGSVYPAWGGDNRRMGLSVRLVRDVPSN